MTDSLDSIDILEKEARAGGTSHPAPAQRRKLGQHASTRDLPKKSGYLLKKGPLKVMLGHRFISNAGVMTY